MSEGGLEDYIKTIINCEAWNNMVYSIKEKEKNIIESKKNSLDNLESIKLVYFRKSDTMTEVLYAYKDYNIVLDEMLGKY